MALSRPGGNEPAMNETNRRVAIITGGSQGIGAGLSNG
jgi:hypothetical protein